MINEFHISGYRGFSQYSLAKLSRVNVFVGKNNAGKSSLLEALHLYSTQLDIQTLQSIALRRGELFLDMESRMVDQLQFDLSHFFNGHRIKRNIVIELSSEKHTQTLQVNSYKERLQGEFHEPAFFSDHSRQDVCTLSAASKTNQEIRPLYDMTISTTGAMCQTRRSYPRSSSFATRVFFISPDSLDNATLMLMWNKMLVRNDESKIVNALRILDPSVDSIAFLLPETINTRYVQRSPLSGVVVGIAKENRRYPLGSMGDGMKRLLAIALALSCSSGGTLFIDEIDSGLHYSVMRDLWRLVINTAIANNVQVFVSTHSLDCLRGLSVLTSETFRDKSPVSLYTINANDTEAVYYSSKEIDTIIKNELEVR